MRKQHHISLKIHTIYTLVLSLVFAALLFVTRDLTLGVVMVFLLLYIAGNGIIHAHKNVLHRDTLIEYVVVAIIALVLLFGYLS